MLRLAWLATASALLAPQMKKPPTTRLRAAPLVELYGERISINDETLIDTLSLKVDKGDRVALVGPNGSGKSTLARLLGQRVFSGGFGQAPESTAMQRPKLGREALGKGIAELRVEQRSTALAPFPPPNRLGAHHVSFEAHRTLLAEEAAEFAESRFSVVHKRATVASYLFPEFYPSALSYAGYEPRRTRLAPLPVARDAGSDDEALEALDAAALSNEALKRFRLIDKRHTPLHALSTGEARALLACEYFAREPRPSLLVLDEAFDGLDEAARATLQAAISEEAASDPSLTIVQVAHRREDLVDPTKAVVLDGSGGAVVGDWEHVGSKVLEQLEVAPPITKGAAPRQPDAFSVGRGGAKTWGRRGVLRDIASDEVVRFEDVRAAYDGIEVFRDLSFVINAGEAVALLGPNGCGKSTVVDMITGDSPLAFGQAVTLFGRRKGSGESVWDIKRKIGQVTPRSHMQYLTFCDPHNAADAVGRSGKTVSSRDVVMSGFYDTIGLYDRPSPGHADIADAWVATLGIGDLVSATPGSFTRLSLGQQKLVLLCRALVKRPRLLVLDEPTHALSRSSRDRFLNALQAARDAADVAVLYVSHRADEIETLNCDDVVRLGAPQQQQAFDGMSCVAFKLDALATTTPRTNKGWVPPESWGGD